MSLYDGHTHVFITWRVTSIIATPPYSWNIAKVGIKHQPINQSVNLLLH